MSSIARPLWWRACSWAEARRAAAVVAPEGRRERTCPAGLPHGADPSDAVELPRSAYEATVHPERTPDWFWRALIVWAVASAVAYEVRTSALQARLLSRFTSQLSFTVQPGPSRAIVFPSRGPFNERAGYVRLPEFQRRLDAAGYGVTEQARMSKAVSWLIRHDVTPPYREPTHRGLLVRGNSGASLYDPASPVPRYRQYEDVPHLVVKTLLFIENRELADLPEPWSNPAVEWDRMARASLFYFGRRLGFPVPIEGGSTLATQLEKFRHSPGGRTAGAGEKLRQIAAASLRAYRNGLDTRTERREIVLEYLNTVPLAAAPDYGEVHGLGEGLRVWFGLDMGEMSHALSAGAGQAAQVRAYKHFLALLCAVRAPSLYLLHDRDLLEARADLYARLMAREGILDRGFAEQVEEQPLGFAAQGLHHAQEERWAQRKAVNAVRNELLKVLGVEGLHELDRLHLEVDTTIDGDLQRVTSELFRKLGQDDFVTAQGLRGDRLLSHGDPARVIYSFLLFERSPDGNLLRAQVDGLEQPFDLNEGMKLELGSTAKLRTVSHYLQMMANLYDELKGVGEESLHQRMSTAQDPLTRWSARMLIWHPGLDRNTFLRRALERRYPANPDETFFTGGGVHAFRNFDPEDDRRVRSVREALQQSTNLVFVRLMRDIVEFHVARLPYDAKAVLRDVDHPERHRLLGEIAEEESIDALRRVFRARTSDEARGRPHDVLKAWVDEQLREPGITWSGLLARSTEVRRASGSWLLDPRKREAQNLRLRTRIERDAFEEITRHWWRLGFPFGRLVPSLATAIGSAGDRPAALADLMGIILNEGVRRPVIRIRRLQFGVQTPYHTVFDRTPVTEETVMDPAVARALREVLAEVVELGTARRMAGAIRHADGTVVTCGGKTGSGDNRFETLGPDGQVLTSRVINRTATFVFYVGERHFGVITAFVAGPEAERYRFTSTLPVTVLKLLSPALSARLDASPRS